jgi:hypothetical protein
LFLTDFLQMLVRMAPRARENGLSVPSVTFFLRVIAVHSGHDIFIQGIEHKRRLILTFFCMEHQRNLIRLCAPLHYSTGKSKGDGLDCYYLWDFEADDGNNVLALPKSQIVAMELTEDAFRVEDFSSSEKTKVRPTKGPD